MKYPKRYTALILITGAFLGIGFHSQFMWWVKGPFISSRLVLMAEAGILALFFIERLIIGIRSRISGRPGPQLLKSEALTSLPLSVTVLVLFETLMPVQYYAELVWAVGIGASILLKGLLILRDFAGRKSAGVAVEFPQYSIFGPFKKLAGGRSLSEHASVWIPGILLTVLIPWPTIRLPWLMKTGFARMFTAGAFLALEIWLLIFYASSLLFARFAGPKKSRYSAPALGLLILSAVWLIPILKPAPDLWEKALSLPPVMTRPLFSGSKNVLLRRVGMWNETRDSVVARVPAALFEDLEGDRPRKLHIAYGIFCRENDPGKGAAFSMVSNGVEIWKADLNCPAVPWRDGRIVDEIDGVRGKIELKISPTGGASKTDVVAVVSAHADPVERPDMPNVVLILVDAMRADHLGVYGYPKDTSPNIDKLASEGMVFETAESQAPHTTPSTASILTGLYPPNHGVDDIIDRSFNSSVVTLGELFRKAGYATAGFTGTNIITHFLGLTDRFEDFDSRCVPDMNWKSAECMAGRIIPWIRENSGRPFFIYAHMFDPHDSYMAPPPFTEMFCNAPPDNPAFLKGDLRGFTRGFLINFPAVKMTKNDIEYLKCRYDGEIRYADEEIGKIVKALDDRGLKDDTVILITADHGEEFMEHGRLLHGQSLLEDQTHVPFILVYPREVRAGKLRATVQSVDMAPTLLDLAGVNVPPGMDGRSLVQMIRSGEDAPESGRAYSWTDHITYRSVSIRAGKWKYILTTLPSKKELYDVEADPGEENNLASQYPRLVRAFDEEAGKMLERRDLPDLRQGLSPETMKTLRSMGYIR